MSNDSPYVMSISLNALNHLGINLYSNVPAVLSELVANAYDADANLVQITVEEKTISICDDGSGMTRPNINERYLTVGYSRRNHQPGLTPGGRAPMGRKGIGKLAVFSIADQVKVYSVKNGGQNGLKLSRRAIEELIKNEKPGGESNETPASYHPVPLLAQPIGADQGTLLVLSQLRRARTATLTIDYLKRRLARRFTIIGARHNFRILVNGQEVTSRDRGFYQSLEFVWFFGEVDPAVVAECTSIKEVRVLSNVVDEAEGYRIRGWIGTVGEPKQLGDRSEEGNSIVVFSRGKLVHENVLPEFREARVFAQYIVGDIEADFIDIDDLDDLATSDRQRLVADDPRYRKLKSHVERAIKDIGLQWTGLRNESGARRALEHPAIELWYEHLSKDNQNHARKLFGKIESLPINDSRSKAELYKSSILAFEKMALTGQLATLDAIDTKEGIDTLLSIFHSVDELEAAHYYEIAKGRLKVINKFEDLVEADSKERVLQDYLFDHLWLLDPSWERASSSRRLEQTVTKEFEDVAKRLTEEERSGRIDIRFSTRAGKHVIVELKKYGVRIDVNDLAKQAGRYRKALHDVLQQHFPDQLHYPIEIVCILGSSPTGLDPMAVDKTLSAIDARYVTYDQLITSAQDAYAEYLAKEKEVSTILQFLDELDQSFDSQSGTNSATISIPGSVPADHAAFNNKSKT